MYVAMRGLGQATTVNRQAVLERAVSLLPACYSAELDRCLVEQGGTACPNCDEINAGWNVDGDRMDAELAKLPYCPDPDQSGSVLQFAIAAASGMAVGFIVGRYL